MPFVVSLRNGDSGVVVDAIMLEEGTVSVLFSFTRSYFHVDLAHVGEVVKFLKTILPLKRVSELFTVLGRAKQGKTERYRELFGHLQQSDDQFMLAPGERGLVMICFTLPSFDVVFKLIRDKFPYQKNILREDVLDQVRARVQARPRRPPGGRAGVQAASSSRGRASRPTCSRNCRSEAARTVHVEGDDLIIDHLYIERRMTPLNLYLRTATREDAEKAVLDYGQAIRDLAVTNIFPGDLLLKNFGVTRHGRVIFYDYDELCLVTDCRFREMPQSQHDEDDMRADAWFYVGESDVFPGDVHQLPRLRSATEAGVPRRACRGAHRRMVARHPGAPARRRAARGPAVPPAPCPGLQQPVAPSCARTGPPPMSTAHTRGRCGWSHCCA